MNRIITAHVRTRAAVANAIARRVAGPRDRGDVPGWVLVTIMTAGLVTALWAIAGPQLGDLFSDAISDVKGP
ncbi:hypothetical protein [Terrabacter sp. MAHUQ-38]|uniref:hypothetical protein n=1 Tax=unclassified Terrabacter TaxID=2630222 RepID=UPI00165D7349|nr:hypothetical protein [Terrabacter sp. MAHUQ-38]MBC9822752.1 hypothetical protein [Terrabacter sp. MAHUQ-38]